MLRVGLTGGLGSGKSFIGRTLERLGCVLIRADDLGHAVIAPDGEAYHPVMAAFGSAILNEDGTIDRRRLGDLVFSDPQKLALLNSIVHPPVFRREEELIARAHQADPSAITVVEAAIMVEAGSHRHYDKLIVASCREEQQIERAMERDGMTREQTEARLRRQMPLADKVKLADYVIDTSGTKEETIRQTELVYQDLRSQES